MKILATGVTSGLGRYLHQKLHCDGWRRAQPLPEKYYDIIIHCAHDHKTPWQNMDMLQRLHSVPCGLFVYISSVDVYRSGFENHYGAVKLSCEQFVRSSFERYKVVRPSMMLGPYSRKNNLIRMLNGERLTLTADSTVGVVSHAALLEEILGGDVGDITLAGNIMTIKDIAAELGLCPEYGDFPYHTPPVRATHDTINEIKRYSDELTRVDPATDEGKAG